jgi:hypothetical protein
VSEYTAEFADDEHDVGEAQEELGAPDELTTEFMPAVTKQMSSDPSATVSGSADLTASSSNMPMDDSPDDVGTATVEVPEPASPEERLEKATDRIEEWLLKTKSQVDAPISVATDSREAARADEIPLEQPQEVPEGEPTRDDSDHVERMLAEIESANAAGESNEVEFPAEEKALGEEQPAEIGPQAPPTTEQPQFFIPPGRLPRRKKSILRTVATTAVSGIIGLALGYYALLWILGPTGDFLGIAQYLPGATLPAEFQSELATRPVERISGEPANESLPGVNEENGDSGTAEQASYTTQSDNAQNIATYVPEARDEPQSLMDEMNATPLSQADDTSTGHVTNAPAFSADELAVALQAAQEAQPKLVAGSLDDGREVQRAKGFGYSILCDLAQKLAFVDKAQRADYANALTADVERLFQQTLADEHARGEVARILPKWIASPNRKHGGVFFAGTPLESVEKGSVVECQLDAGAGGSIAVLLPPASAEQLADSSQAVGIVGWIVDSPASHVTGYTGDAPQAIWVSRILALE